MRIAKFEVTRIAKYEVVRIAKRMIERMARYEILRYAKYQVMRFAKRVIHRIPKLAYIGYRIAKRVVERVAKGIDPSSVVKKFLPLIQWASNKFSRNYHHTQFTYQDFYDTGVETLAFVLDKKVLKFATQVEFGKYFKTALYRNMRRIQKQAYQKKRTGIIFSIDNSVLSKDKQNRDFEIPDGSFSFPHSIMVEDCKRLLKGVEKLVFEYLVNPPEDFTLFILRAKSRKEKIALIEGLPIREKKLTHRCMCGYFESRGVPEHIYRLAYNRVKEVVGQYIKGE